MMSKLHEKFWNMKAPPSSNNLLSHRGTHIIGVSQKSWYQKNGPYMSLPLPKAKWRQSPKQSGILQPANEVAMLPLRFSRQAWLASESFHVNVQITPEEVSHEIHEEVALCQQETDLNGSQRWASSKKLMSAVQCLWLWLRFQRHVVGHYPIGLVKDKQAGLRGHALYSVCSNWYSW